LEDEADAQQRSACEFAARESQRSKGGGNAPPRPGVCFDYANGTETDEREKIRKGGEDRWVTLQQGRSDVQERKKRPRLLGGSSSSSVAEIASSAARANDSGDGNKGNNFDMGKVGGEFIPVPNDANPDNPPQPLSSDLSFVVRLFLDGCTSALFRLPSCGCIVDIITTRGRGPDWLVRYPVSVWMT
jgi:hypothetical protein